MELAALRHLPSLPRRNVRQAREDPGSAVKNRYEKIKEKDPFHSYPATKIAQVPKLAVICLELNSLNQSSVAAITQ